MLRRFSYQLPVAGYNLPVTGYKLQVTGPERRLPAGRQGRGLGFQLFNLLTTQLVNLMFSRFTFAVSRITPLLLLSIPIFAQDLPKKIDSNYNNVYYQGRMELFNTLTPPKNAIVFLGNSITERGAWSELLPGKPIMNRGIGGDNTFGVLARLEGVVKAQPKKLFLLIGINDLSRGLPKEVIINNYHRIIQYLVSHTPKTKIYIQSVLPLNEPMTTPAYLKNKKDSILQLNVGIRQVAEQYHLPYINLHEIFADGNGDLKKELTADGIHLKPAAYVMWVDFLRKRKYL